MTGWIVKGTLALLVLSPLATAHAQDLTEVRCREWMVMSGLKSTNFCASGDMVPVDAQWWSEIKACRGGDAAYQASQQCQALFKEAQGEPDQVEPASPGGTPFIALSATEFSEQFNRASQVYRLKHRLPVWTSTQRSRSATLGPGLTVAIRGTRRGDWIERVTVSCKRARDCQDAMYGVALTVAPDINLKSFTDFLEQKIDGKIDGLVMRSSGMYFYVDPNRRQQSIEMRVVASDE